MININLEEPASLPIRLQERLGSCERHFLEAEFLDELRDIPEIAGLIEDINQLCSENMVTGFHYTRAIPEHILTLGLRPRSGAEIRSQFLRRFGHMFTTAEIRAIQAIWASYYDTGAQNSRDNVLYFNFTRHAMTNSGAAPLLKYYGGEQVYFCIDELPGIGEKLSSIGRPIIVKCALIPSRIRTFIAHPWGLIAVSASHKRVNPQAHQIDQDGRQTVPVPPEHIELVYL